MTSPAVTIGIPVFNEEKFLPATLASALAQTASIFAFDNASTDASFEFLKKEAARFPQITLHQQAYNKGGLENMQDLLMACTTPYFMWLGAHDLLPATYVDTLQTLLEKNPSHVLAYGGASYITEKNEPESFYDGWPHQDLQQEDPLLRVFTLIQRLEDCTLVHGLFRTEALKKAWFDRPCLGFDHVLLCRLAAQGPFIFTPETHYIRRQLECRRPYVESDKEQLSRIQGDNTLLSSSPDRSLMQEEQLRTLETLPTHHWLRKAWYVWRSRKILPQRFGAPQKG